ncbi:MAG: hypothetical protein AB7E85_04225 [Pseudobdellovibrionaceae bacterium]
MKRITLMATVALLAVTGAAHADTVSQEVIYSTPTITPIEAFDKMDLDNNWEVNTIEYDWAVKHHPDVAAYSYEGLDINNNGIITRKEAKNVDPAAAAMQKTIVKTVIKDPVVVDVVEPAAGTVVVTEPVGMRHTTTRTTTTYPAN